MVLSLAVGGLFFRWVMKRLDPNYAAEQRVRPHTDFVNLHSSPHVSEKSVALESKLVCCIHSCAYFRLHRHAAAAAAVLFAPRCNACC